MKKVEDRTTDSYKAQERSFYSDQWIYNDRINDQQKIIDNPEISAEEKKEAEKKKAELEIERQNEIDKWKEKHGEYNEEMTNWTIGDSVKHSKDGTGLSAMQERYDENQYGHEEEYEDDYEY